MPEINLGRVQGTGGGRHIVDIGSEELDVSTLDFSNYAAGDEILIVGDMPAGLMGTQEGGA